MATSKNTLKLKYKYRESKMVAYLRNTINATSHGKSTAKTKSSVSF